MNRESRLVRVERDLHKAAKVTAALLDIRITEFANESARKWVESEGDFFPNLKNGDKQILIPTDDDLDRSMRVRAAMEGDGVATNNAYASALFSGVASSFFEIKFDGISKTIPAFIEQTLNSGM